MNSRVRTIVLIAALGMASLASGSAMAGTGAPAAALGRHAWHTAIEVPGTAALNAGGRRAGQLGVVRLGGELQRRRDLHRQLRQLPGVRGRPR